MNRLWEELKRRNVVRVGIAYAVVSWLIIEVASTVFPILELPNWATRLVLIILLLGFPVTLVFAWAFELTPEGLKKEEEVDRSRSITATTGRKLDRIIIAMMAVAITYLVAANYVFDGAALNSAGEATDKSVAVLPFVALSSGPDDEYFADGLTEEILNSLAQLPDLEVTARTSSFYFKGQNLPIPEIASKLNVAHVVEGSVRREGDRIRATAQLIRASDDTHLWSENYNRTLDDTFAVQEDIAANVAAAFGVALDETARMAMRDAGIRDVGAFIAYQKGLEANEIAHQSGIANIAKSLEVAGNYFDQALEAAPNLTRARLAKADRRGHIVWDIAAGLREEAYPGELQETRDALNEEYDLAWQLSAPGRLREIVALERQLISDDWRGLTAIADSALKPGQCISANWVNETLGPLGWADRLADRARDLLTCDPLNANVHLPILLIWTGKYEAAIRAVTDAEARGHKHTWLSDARFWALLAANRLDDPAAQGPGLRNSMIQFPRQLLHHALTGDAQSARQLAEGYLSGPDAQDSTRLVLAAVLGDRSRANEVAARIDRLPGSAFVLSGSTYTCFCGAPFDLEATPNFRARLEEAGLDWPPPKHIDYPTKTW
jgi:adenylate cyclase